MKHSCHLSLLSLPVAGFASAVHPTRDRKLFTRAFDYLAAKAMQVIRMTTGTALACGCPDVIYWQLYDNETLVSGRPPENHETRGFYMVRPDGSHGPAWDYFANLIAADRRR